MKPTATNNTVPDVLFIYKTETNFGYGKIISYRTTEESVCHKNNRYFSEQCLEQRAKVAEEEISIMFQHYPHDRKQIGAIILAALKGEK